MSSLQVRLVAAFAAIAIVSAAAVAVLTSASVRAEFDRYLFGGPPAGRIAPDRPGEAPQRMPRMMSPEQMRAMMRRVMGAPELRFLDQLRRAAWQAAGVGVLAAVLLGILTARYLTAPLRRMSAAAAQVGRGDLSQEVPVPPGDELGMLAQAFNAMTADLRRLEQSRRHLVADIAHELGTPLSVLQANLEGMLDGLVEPSTDRLAALHTQTRLLSRLVEDLRDLSLAQAGRLVLQLRSADLEALVADAVAAVAPYASEKSITIRSALSGGIPHVRVDRERIAQVIHNLLDNAIRYTPAGGTVTVGTGAADLGAGSREIRLWVSDTGPGIPPEEEERVFERFYRSDPSRSRASGGSGLGLAIVKSLVEAHGGRAWASGRPGEGSTFTIALPLPTS